MAENSQKNSLHAKSGQCPTQLLVAKCAAETEWGAPRDYWEPHLGHAIRTKTITDWRAVSQEIGGKKFGNLFHKMLQIMGSIAKCYQMQGTRHLIVLHPQILLLCYIIELCPVGNN